LEVEGHREALSRFFATLPRHLPRQAVVAGIVTEELPPQGSTGFEVVASQREGAIAVQLPPDLGTCDACLDELHDPRDRRYRYPFTNCVDCGPRFTIIRELPYDRVNTSMERFRLCAECAREYEDPADRRFHAEPNACPVCGPRLRLLGEGGRCLAEGEAALRQAQAFMKQGAVVAVKGLGGYHLACDALDPAAVARLRERKQRPHKALAVMLRDLQTVRRYFRPRPEEVAELLSPARPIVVLDGVLSPAVSPDTNDTGVFLPYTPLHHLLLEEFTALVMTSGNRLEEPIAQDEGQALRLLEQGIADVVLAHDRPVLHRCDDSVLRMVGGRRHFLRRSRGFVPAPVRIAEESPVILATGSDLKNTFCLVVGGLAYLSQHIGDLAEHSTYTFFEEEIDRWLELLRVTPTLVAHDLHPGYLSSRYASRLDGMPAVAVQHHHAHVASVMAECGLTQPVLGVALDGTGYGEDDSVWGGEFLLADRAGFERVAHFGRYPLPGGEKAIEEPWRMAAAVCRLEGIEWRGPAEQYEGVVRLLTAGLNCPPASSAGRLFDAAAALLGLCEQASYEAQGAIRLEAVADLAVRRRYSYSIRAEATQGVPVLDFGPAFVELAAEARRGVAAAEISAAFHNTIVAGCADLAARLAEEREVRDIVLSGGVFQNRMILARLTEELRNRGLSVYSNTMVPANDAGLSLGQAAVALARWEKGELACV
jgi:hydrogenase maturation protein HypF